MKALGLSEAPPPPPAAAAAAAAGIVSPSVRHTLTHRRQALLCFGRTPPSHRTERRGATRIVARIQMCEGEKPAAERVRPGGRRRARARTRPPVRPRGGASPREGPRGTDDQ
ncbi:hypothetical protein F2P81_026351 [Scophthalmus maximus]|uniref:Uncharacterized protein n=1 Tax=Scophthalmus maximus TaxID=52904 RepID=A0A6A4RML4_SCOMX|nr:hypothetical protein F2P81_026351 [Scophthalmus maximus]